MQPGTAKINRKHIQRSAVFVVVIAIVAYATYWLMSKHGDPDLLHPPAATIGYIAAVERTANGSQAVLIKPDGTVVPAPDYKDGAIDEHVAWRPDGGRLFFVSDRVDNTPQVFRWDPDNNLVERRTVDNRPKGFMTFEVPGEKDKSDVSSGLVISGGTVLSIDANSGVGTQLLPPHDKNAAAGTEEGGSQDEMSSMYSNYGTSFSRAYYGKGKNFVVAIMNREDGGQALIVQDLTNAKQPPFGVLQAEHISVDIGPITGQILITAQGYEVPDWLPEDQKAKFRKGNALVPPFKHMVALFDPTQSKDLNLMIASGLDRIAFGNAKFSPDESEVVLPVGSYSGNTFTAVAVATMPARKGGGQAVRPLARGNFSDASFSPDGKKILALLAGPSGRKAIVTLDDVSGTTPIGVTQGSADFTEAVYSPQVSGG